MSDGLPRITYYTCELCGFSSNSAEVLAEHKSRLHPPWNATDSQTATFVAMQEKP